MATQAVRKENPKVDHRAPIGGWAPGPYLCRCLRCAELFEGDKRAYSCADCAYSRAAETE